MWLYVDLKSLEPRHNRLNSLLIGRRHLPIVLSCLKETPHLQRERNSATLNTYTRNQLSEQHDYERFLTYFRYVTQIWFHKASKDRWYHNSLSALQGGDNLSLKIKQTVSTHYNPTWLKFSELCTTLYRFSHAPDQKNLRMITLHIPFQFSNV